MGRHVEAAAVWRTCWVKDKVLSLVQPAARSRAYRQPSTCVRGFLAPTHVSLVRRPLPSPRPEHVRVLRVPNHGKAIARMLHPVNGLLESAAVVVAHQEPDVEITKVQPPRFIGVRHDIVEARHFQTIASEAITLDATVTLLPRDAGIVGQEGMAARAHDHLIGLCRRDRHALDRRPPLGNPAVVHVSVRASMVCHLGPISAPVAGLVHPRAHPSTVADIDRLGVRGSTTISL